ncbi:MAG: alpha/beta hydrolase [Burkholderiaceae bacterium]|nr:alpha/beta hydrolase [Burkholderiaceae bacterium]MCD8516770.1 alpha/beta hydrolase [Burkholderiaceae bacterium]MCD8564401.1 alpha/beta hydrolase [Burkholderiaceae bacterium]
MSAPRVKTIACASPGGLHRMAYYDWGDPDNLDVVLCVHGLTRTGRDFDVLAEHLSKRFRVICPDVAGRGLSDWLAQPLSYAVPQYAADMVALISQLQPKTLRWVGTSMGGLIALTYAALVAQAKDPDRQVPPARQSTTIDDAIVPISRLVLNDVGPRIEAPSLARIGQYLAEPKSFASFEEAVQYMKETAASFGPHSDPQWEMLTRHYFVPSHGKWVKHYDPAIAMAFAGVTPELISQGELMLWQAYQCVQAPTLIMHGEQSDLLLADTVDAMLAANPHARAHTVKGVGHAPSLIVQDQINVVSRFLDGD